MVEQGVDVGEFVNHEYSDLEDSYLRRRSRMKEINQLITELGMKLTKAELLSEGQRRTIPIAVLADSHDVVESPQLKGVGYFVNVDHPEIGAFEYPGAPYRLSASPCQTLRPAPLIGQHNQEIYHGLGLKDEDIATLKQIGAI